MPSTNENSWLIDDWVSLPSARGRLSFRWDLTDRQEVAICPGSGEAAADMSQCPDQHEAKKLFNLMRLEGRLCLTLSKHAEAELAKDDMDTQDCLNILRGGVWEAPEWENGTWRYRAWTQKMTVVVGIDFESAKFCIVTAWRNT